MTETATALVASRLSKTPEEKQRAVQARNQLIRYYPDIYYDWDLDWDQIRAHAGGFEQAYRMVAEQYRPLIIIEGFNSGYFLSRGLYSMALAQLRQGVAPIAYRQGHFYVVTSVAKTRSNDWKGNYATAWANERWF